MSPTKLGKTRNAAIDGFRRTQPIRHHYFDSEGMRAQAPCALLCCPGGEIVRLPLDTVDCFARSWESGLGANSVIRPRSKERLLLSAELTLIGRRVDYRIAPSKDLPPEATWRLSSTNFRHPPKRVSDHARVGGAPARSFDRPAVVRGAGTGPRSLIRGLRHKLGDCSRT